MVATNEIRQLATERVSSWKIMQASVADGMRSLRGDAWLKVLHGVSSVDEVAKNAKADHSLIIKR
jgi:general secretion pathway protein E/type IV pilus assembly protein PilB